ncbi:hypothetical protein HPP92_012282 [Vanilla planifolia]|uniref:Nop domain-containing protein n=1 Tax=Vanilla planifolia TaxID=51239 RepID=A0A835R3E6_VANPL|nr:hypothetical protein HPP92_012282 [Vanilla planifolia]
MELMRGLRSQLTELISGLGVQDLAPMSLGLSHSLSRYKLKFSPDKVDTMIIQAIGLLDDLDRELNTYAMRVREWYGWHFPELAKIVQDNIQAQLYDYLRSRMNTIAPNLTALVGELVELGSSLMVALFRALKTKHATPKYGLIFHASLIGQAAPKLKGKISRSLAAKAALAIRYDALGDGQDNSMGLENRAKLEARLRVLEGRELGRSAGSVKGKPKIEVYDKDRKKGAGALITSAKTYNPSSDLVLRLSGENNVEKPASGQEESHLKKRKHEEVELMAAEAEGVEAREGEESEKRKKKKKKKAEVEVETENNEVNIEYEGEKLVEKEDKKSKKKKKVEAVVDSDEPALGETPQETSIKEKKKKKKYKEVEDGGNQDAQEQKETEKSSKKKKQKNRE